MTTTLNTNSETHDRASPLGYNQKEAINPKSYSMGMAEKGFASVSAIISPGEIYEFVSGNDHFCFFSNDTLGDADTVNARCFTGRTNVNSQRALLSVSSAWLLG